MYDSIISLCITTLGAILFSNYGIYVALSLSLFLSLLSFCVILIFWEENNPNKMSKHKTSAIKKVEHFILSLRNAFNIILQSRKILFLGIIDAIYSCSIQILIFIWTPLLQYTSGEVNINTGTIFISMILATLAHNKILTVINIVYKNQQSYYWICLNYMLFFCMFYFCSFIFDSFTIRVILVILINGSGGIMHPVISYLKSDILVEKYRAILMNIFMTPSNILVSIIYLTSHSFPDPPYICLFVGVLNIISIVGSFLLLMEKRKDSQYS